MAVQSSSSSSFSSQRSLVLDVAGIVSSLIESKKGPLNRVETEITKKNLSISAMGVFKSKVSAFQSAVKTLENKGLYSSSDAVKSAIEGYVSTYNDLLSFYRTVSRPKSGSKEIEYQGALMGDWASRSVMDSIGDFHRTGGVASDGATFSFYSVGVMLESDGRLSIDYSKLNTAAIGTFGTQLSSGVTVGSASTSVSGITSYLSTALSATGLIDTAVFNASDQVSSLESRKSELEFRLESMREAYTRQYAALDSQLAKLQSLSSSYSSFFSNFNKSK